MLKWLMLTLYIAVISYILWRSIHCIRNMTPRFRKKRIYLIYSCMVIIVCSTLLLGGMLPKSDFRTSLHKFSNVWLGFLIYILFFAVITDLIILLIKLFGRKRNLNFLKTTKGYIITPIFVVVVSAAFTLYGNVHAKYMVVNSYDVQVDKSIEGEDELNIVLISDLHLGYSVGCSDMEKMVGKINKLDADIVVVAGDIVDNEYEALDNPDKLAKILRGIKSKYGTYAVYGNHDVEETLIGGFSISPARFAFRDKRVERFLEACNFIVLQDESELIDDRFYIVGRLDGEKAGDGTSNRMKVEQLTHKLDKNKPIIMVAHEPDELQESADAGVDILLNGHTHAGQFFPLTIAQPIAWKNYWGYMKVDKMHDYVSSGIGVYGPNLRVFTDSEIMLIKARFKK